VRASTHTGNKKGARGCAIIKELPKCRGRGLQVLYIHACISYVGFRFDMAIGLTVALSESLGLGMPAVNLLDVLPNAEL